jgi:hypothetical protein
MIGTRLGGSLRGVGFGRRSLILVGDKMAEIGMLHERFSNVC